MTIPPNNSGPSSPIYRPKGPNEPQRKEKEEAQKKDREQKEFRLPHGNNKKEEELKKLEAEELSKKEALKQKEHKDKPKKKTVFDLAGLEVVKEIKQEISSASSQAVKGSEKTSPIAAKDAMSQITRLIQTMATEMRVGTVDGKNFTSLTLAANRADVPKAFSGSHLTLNFNQANGLSIQFDRFTTPQQEQTAIYIVEQNKEQLTQMLQALSAKNIQVAQLTIGQYQVALPRVQPLPPPFTVSPPDVSAEGRYTGEEGGQREGNEEEPE